MGRNHCISVSMVMVSWQHQGINNMLIGLWRQWNEENERGGEKRIVGEAMIIQGRQTLIDVISNILGAQWNMFTLVLSFDFGLTGSVAFIKR